MNKDEKAFLRRKIKNIKDTTIYNIERFSLAYKIDKDQEFIHYKNEIERSFNKILDELNKYRNVGYKEYKPMDENIKNKLKLEINKIKRNSLYLLHCFEQTNNLEDNIEFQSYLDITRKFFNDLVKKLKQENCEEGK